MGRGSGPVPGKRERRPRDVWRRTTSGSCSWCSITRQTAEQTGPEHPECPSAWQRLGRVVPGQQIFTKYCWRKNWRPSSICKIPPIPLNIFELCCSINGKSNSIGSLAHLFDEDGRCAIQARVWYFLGSSPGHVGRLLITVYVWSNLNVSY